MWRLLITFLAFLSAASADSWVGPQVTEVFSKDRTYFVRVTPGKESAFKFADIAKRTFAKAEWFKRQDDGSYKITAETALLNPVAPVDFWVSDSGHLVTRDNWHSVGYGNVIAIYGPDAKLIKAYKLKDFFSEDQIREMRHSVSSIWWHKGTPAYIQPDQTEFYMALDQKGTELIFKLSDGSFRYCAWQGEQHVCR